MNPKGIRSEAPIPLNITLTSLPNTSGQVSDGISPVLEDAITRTSKYLMRIKVKTAAVAAMGGSVDVYLITSDGTLHDGNVSPVNATLNAASVTAAKINLTLLGSLYTNGTDTIVGSVEAATWGKTLSVLIVNSTGQALSATASDHKVTLAQVVDME